MEITRISSNRSFGAMPSINVIELLKAAKKQGGSAYTVDVAENLINTIYTDLYLAGSRKAGNITEINLYSDEYVHNSSTLVKKLISYPSNSSDFRAIVSDLTKALRDLSDKRSPIQAGRDAIALNVNA